MLLFIVLMMKINKISMPMKHFTPEEFKPSALSLEIIRQVAYSYRPVSNPQARDYSLN